MKHRHLIAAAFAACALIMTQPAGAELARRAAPHVPAVTPQLAGDGSFRLRLRLSYFKSVTGGLEVRRQTQFADDNLKLEIRRNVAFWTVSFPF